MEVQAKAKWVRTSPRKARLVARTLRNLPVSEALVACSFMPKSAARDVAKVIRSAQANAENNFNLVRDDLVIKDIRVEPGPMLKRGQPRAMGRLFSIFKRTSHITAIVEDRPGAVRRRTAALPRAPQPAARPTPTSNAAAAARAAASRPATTESDEREAPKPKRGKAEPKAQAEGSTGTEVGKKTQAKKTDKSPQAKTTNARAEGKNKDQDKTKKQDKKGK
ncbi:MAG: 50S ribosomal protein L22 [Chloroflexi bacterium]|nr:MAG: 50S ribosomal protein L22 [Chloroflexota bacterium]